MISPSDLLLTDDGKVYHLNLAPRDVAPNVILVGDPARVDLVASFFDSIECNITHREFHTITGWRKGKRISAMSTGISSDNVDILMSELDALFNIDLKTREVKQEITQLEVVRIGTCGILQDSIELGSFIMSAHAIGLDGMVSYYADSWRVRMKDVEQAFINELQWSGELPRPYAVRASEDMIKRFKPFTLSGCTVCGGGFFAPQGRTLRLKPTIEGMTDKLAQFHYGQLRITNFEMEGAALTAMCNMLGHKSVTICLGIAHRTKTTTNVNYQTRMAELIELVLDGFSL